jgi:endoribonuclease Dicer
MLLIATDAAEEGIDVADCSFVVRFSRFGTTRSHIQGSGRGRARDTEFYYFENDGEDEQGKAALLNDVARDEALALSPAMRAAHPESTAASAALTSTEAFYPFQPQGEGMVNLSNATKILLEY